MSDSSSVIGRYIGYIVLDNILDIYYIIDNCTKYKVVNIPTYQNIQNIWSLSVEKSFIVQIVLKTEN